MSDFEKNESLENEDYNPDLEPEEEEEFGIIDKMIGVFTEPSATFAKMAKMELKVSDWLVPLLLAIIIGVGAGSIQMLDPQIKMQVQEMQIEKIRASMQEAVDSGRMSEAQVDAIVEQARGNMERFGGISGMLMTLVALLIIVPIITVIIAAYYLFIAKVIFKGEGAFMHSLVAVCLPSYINAFGAIIQLIAAMVLTKFLPDFSLASFMGVDPMTGLGFILSKLDIFQIWAYAVVAIGLAKLFKSQSTGKYMVAVFASWIGFGAIWWGIKLAVPFLQSFGF